MVYYSSYGVLLITRRMTTAGMLGIGLSQGDVPGFLGVPYGESTAAARFNVRNHVAQDV
jgi:hypothetical protein